MCLSGLPLPVEGPTTCTAHLLGSCFLLCSCPGALDRANLRHLPPVPVHPAAPMGWALPALLGSAPPDLPSSTLSQRLHQTFGLHWAPLCSTKPTPPTHLLCCIVPSWPDLSSGLFNTLVSSFFPSIPGTFCNLAWSYSTNKSSIPNGRSLLY